MPVQGAVEVGAAGGGGETLQPHPHRPQHPLAGWRAHPLLLNQRKRQASPLQVTF